MAQDNDLFRTALEGKKIPILTLDHKWHKLFTQTGDNDEIHALETVVNDLLKRQGKLNTEIKSQNLFKKKLMSEIVAIMELPDSPDKNKKMEENKRLIEEANEKMDLCHDELAELPEQIEEANYNQAEHAGYRKYQSMDSEFPGTVKTSGAFETAERNME